MKISARSARGIAVVLVLTVLVVGGYWIVPAALSFYAVAKAPPVVEVVPTELTDLFVSPAAGRRLSYFGYEFEVPWTDLDEHATQLYPRDKPQKNKVLLGFHSGLKIMLTAVPPRELVASICGEMNISQAQLASAFGVDGAKSDYSFVKTIYQFSPETIHHWERSPQESSREQVLLILKSILPLKAAESGIFSLQSGMFRGFQQGNLAKRPQTFAVTLYSDEGALEFIFLQREFNSQAGVTQPEVNRIVRSLRKDSDSANNAQLTK